MRNPIDDFADQQAKADRLPPHSPESEEGVLGCVMLSPMETLPELIEKFPSAEVFYDLRNLTIYDTMLGMYDRNESIDVITLMENLKSQDMLEQVGGTAYLAGLPDKVPSAANLEYYADIVLEKWMLRNLLQTCVRTSDEVYTSSSDPVDLVEKAVRDIERVGNPTQQTGIKPIREIVRGAIDKIEAASMNNGRISGLATGFTDFDRMTSGLQPADVIIIAARPSMGKSSLAMNIAENVAVDQGIPVGIFSLEMTAESLIMRAIGSRARVNMRYVRDGFLAERDVPKITVASTALSKSPLYIDDTSNIPFLKFKARARRMVQVYGVKLIVVDYLQLMKPIQRRGNRQEEVAELSGGIKSIAKELNIPIIVLTQLNRELDKEGKRKPRLSDLRESGAIEQDADLIGILYKPMEIGRAHV